MKKKIIIVLLAVLFAVLTLYGCQQATSAPDAVEEDSNSNESSVVAGFSMESDCGACHTREQESASDGRLMTIHSAVANCTTCHKDESSLTTAHADIEGIKPPTKLKNTSVDAALCSSCHPSDQITSTTAGMLVDSEGNAFNPHDIPVTPSHENVDSISCTGCHKIHGEDDAMTNAKRACDSCHHKKIYVSCSTSGCHADH